MPCGGTRDRHAKPQDTAAVQAARRHSHIRQGAQLPVRECWLALKKLVLKTDFGVAAGALQAAARARQPWRATRC